MINIDIDEKFLELFYKLTNDSVPQNINNEELKRQLDKIAKQINPNREDNTSQVQKNIENIEGEEEPLGPAMMVVDDLGVITYQLKVLLSQFEYDVDCSQEIYDAVNKFKKRDYKYVIMDLFIPTEREGFILLTELKKIAAHAGKKCVIGVITASPRKEIEQQCRARGADFFLEKNNDWQNSLANIMSEYIKEEKGIPEDF